MRLSARFLFFTALFLVMHIPVAEAQARGEKIDSLPRLYVLAVGVNDYQESQIKLRYAVSDAKTIATAMRSAGSSIYKSVEVTLVLDTQVTIDNLEKVFAELSNKVLPEDVFVFFISGQSRMFEGALYFLPQNFRYENDESIAKRGIDNARFQAWFGKIPAHNSILLYEIYESSAHGNNSASQLDIERVAAIDKMSRQVGKSLIVVSSENRVVDAYQGHGLLTHALLDALAAADSNGNGRIEVTELAAFIDEKVPDLSFKAFKIPSASSDKARWQGFRNCFKGCNSETSIATNWQETPDLGYAIDLLSFLRVRLLFEQMQGWLVIGAILKLAPIRLVPFNPEAAVQTRCPFRSGAHRSINI